jgi:Domain of unknown function (DUF4386)
MTEIAAGRSSRARLTGLVYLLYFVTAVLAQVLASRKLVFCGDALNVIADAVYVVLALLLYFLFKPVNRNLSLVAALFSLAGCVVGLLGIFHLAPRHFSPLWFFGPYCLLIGVLILRSTFLPPPLGWLMAAAGLGWLAYLIPQIAKHFSAPIEGVGIVAEASLMLWLLVMGVDEERWRQQATLVVCD